jgi:hypothetical protein
VLKEIAYSYAKFMGTTHVREGQKIKVVSSKLPKNVLGKASRDWNMPMQNHTKFAILGSKCM